jgi:hypothetical protein
MKKLPLLLALLLSGCAWHRTVEDTKDETFDLSNTNLVTKSSDKVTHVGISFFNKTAVEGLTIGKRSGKESTTLSLGKAQTETQTEAIKALGEALGSGLINGAKKSIVP